MSSRRIYDSLVNASTQEAGKAAMSILEALQTYAENDKGAQAVGLCAAFLLFCRRFNLQPQEVFTATGNLLDYARGDARKDFDAVSLYLKNEVKA